MLGAGSTCRSAASSRSRTSRTIRTSARVSASPTICSAPGKTALKASLGHYPDIIRTASGNPANNLTRTTTRTWNDSQFDTGIPGRATSFPIAICATSLPNGECGPWSDLTFGQLVGARYADGVLSGWNRQYANWQGSVSVQHELRPGFGVSAGYFRTWYVGDAGGSGIPGAETTLTVTDNLKVTPRDFDEFCITAPTNPDLPNSGQQLVRPVRRQACAVRPERQRDQVGGGLRPPQDARSATAST